MREAPSSAQIKQQLETLLSGEALSLGQKRRAFVRFIVEMKLASRWDLPTYRKKNREAPAAASQNIIQEFEEKYWSDHQIGEDPTSWGEDKVVKAWGAGRQTARVAGAALQDYYSKRFEIRRRNLNQPDEVYIEIPVADDQRQRAYEPVIGWLSEQTAPRSMTPLRPRHTDLDWFQRHWHRYHLTLDRAGQPIWLHTILQFDAHPDEPDAVYASGPQKLAATDPDIENIYEWTGRMHGGHFVVTSQRRGVSNDIGIELYPQAGHREVLAGVRINDTWQEQPSTIADSIALISKAPLNGLEDHPVGSVSRVHGDALTQLWEQKNPAIRRLPLPDTRVFPRFSEVDVERPLANCGRIRILVSWFPNLGSMLSSFGGAVEKGARLEIIHSHPDSVFAKYRGLAVLQRANAGREEIMRVRNQIRHLKTLGDVEFKLTDIPIPAAFVQISPKDFSALPMGSPDDAVYFSLFWSNRNAVEGPWFQVSASSVFGHALVHQFESLWRPEGPSTHRTAIPLTQADDCSGDPPPILDRFGLRNTGTAQANDSFLTDDELLEFERTVPAQLNTTEIWVAGNMANVGQDAAYSEALRDVVRANASNAISYRYVCPKSQPGGLMYDNLRRCFANTLGGLFIHPVDDEEFARLTLVNCHFICFNPLGTTDRPVYMQLPVIAPRGWAMLRPADGKKVLQMIERLIARYPAANLAK